MNATPRFLVLDDDADTCYLHRRALVKAFPSCEVVEATTCDAALAQAAQGNFDALLSDHHLRGDTGAACIARLRAMGVRCPILTVTASDDPKIHAAASRLRRNARLLAPGRRLHPLPADRAGRRTSTCGEVGPQPEFLPAPSARDRHHFTGRA